MPKDFFIFGIVISFLSICIIFYRQSHFKLALLFLTIFILSFWRSNQFLKKTENLSFENKEIQDEAKVLENPVRKLYNSSIVVYFKNEKIKAQIDIPKYAEILIPYNTIKF